MQDKITPPKTIEELKKKLEGDKAKMEKAEGTKGPEAVLLKEEVHASKVASTASKPAVSAVPEPKIKTVIHPAGESGLKAVTCFFHPGGKTEFHFEGEINKNDFQLLRIRLPSAYSALMEANRRQELNRVKEINSGRVGAAVGGAKATGTGNPDPAPGAGGEVKGPTVPEVPNGKQGGGEGEQAGKA